MFINFYPLLLSYGFVKETIFNLTESLPCNVPKTRLF